ncbi:CotH kinase family protein [Corynebacterium callunae]|uniref:CotH kinase family protein n=1 Tax=Corynebacterium callunae TaxID=1721 RepID=UPI0039825BB9
MNRRLFLGTAASIAVVGGVIGGVQVVPYISSQEVQATAAATSTIDVGAGNVDLFDTSVQHEVSLQVSQENLDEMLADYQEDGSKTWVKATITIDGVTIEDVGIRLKGNSTLQSLSGESRGGAPGAAATDETTEDGEDATAEMPAMPEGMELPEGITEEDIANFQAQMAEGGGMGGGMGGGAGGGAMMSLDINDSSTWPFLISFDKYEEGRVYQGMSQLSIRPGTTVVNEALALALTDATGQATQQSSFMSFSLNDSATTTRLIIEIPDENYADSLGNGVLFKADASSSFTYQGEDQTDYEGQFTQINDEGNGDIQPIINLLKWLDTASDEEFDAHLADYVDVESFARYVATQNLLVNSDDMAGPGKNYYLWYDYDTGLISVVSWDLNMSMSGSTDAGPDDEVSMGGGGGMGRGMMGADATATDAIADATTADAATTDTAVSADLPAGMTPPDMAAGTDTTATTDEAAVAATDEAADTQVQRQRPAGMGEETDTEGGMGGGMMSGNELKERFLASDAFTEIYEQAYWDLYEQMYGSGTATTLLDEIAASIPARDSVSAEDIATKVSTVREWVTTRTEALSALRDTAE